MSELTVSAKSTDQTKCYKHLTFQELVMKFNECTLIKEVVHLASKLYCFDITICCYERTV